MNRILIAALAVVGLAGAAAAQEAPELSVNQAPNHLGKSNAVLAEQGTVVYSDMGFDRLEIGAIAGPAAQPNFNGNYDGTVTRFDIHSGQ